MQAVVEGADQIFHKAASGRGKVHFLAELVGLQAPGVVRQIGIDIVGQQIGGRIVAILGLAIGGDRGQRVIAKL
jgi:hypothetical protein